MNFLCCLYMPVCRICVLLYYRSKIATLRIILESDEDDSGEDGALSDWMWILIGLGALNFIVVLVVVIV